MAAVASSDPVWAAGSGQDMPCGSARGRAGGLGSTLAPASAQAPLMEWGWAAHMALVRRTGGSGGWHAVTGQSPVRNETGQGQTYVIAPRPASIMDVLADRAGGHTCARGFHLPQNEDTIVFRHLTPFILYFEIYIYFNHC